ncbi:hypothetical protein EJ110_NYTH14438 [Nymphaea thermarum]|nr:hypothetical protein EJ110_NYTH14438 [Nymphaea thermarum]
MDQLNSSILSSSFLSQLISQKLNHSNYLTWKRQIVPFIKSHRLYGHIDGTTPAPPQYIDREVKRTVVADQGGGASTGSEIRFEYETVTENNPAYEVWLAHDQSLVAYITSTLSEEVLGSVDDDLTALELWSTLATTYSQLRREFQDIKRGTRTVLEYLNEIKSVSDQLAAIGHPVSDKDKVRQALSGLGTEFDIFCTALEVLPILPSFEDLKAKLFQHEASRVQRQNLISSNSHNGLMQCKGIVPVLGPLRQAWEDVFFQPLQRGHVKSECWHNPQNKNNHIRREGKAAAGAASSSSGQNVTFNIPTDAQQLLMTAISKLQLKQNEQGEWYVDSGAAAHVTGDTGYAENYKGYRCYNPKTGRVHISRHVFDESRLQDPKATPMTLNDKNETYDTWLHVEILRQGAELLPKQKEQATNEPETIVDTSLDSTASLENMSSSPQQDDDPPRDNRFSGLVYSRRTVPTIAPRQSQRARHPIDRWPERRELLKILTLMWVGIHGQERAKEKKEEAVPTAGNLAVGTSLPLEERAKEKKEEAVPTAGNLAVGTSLPLELRSVVLSDTNIVELRSTVLCDVNIVELRSVVLSDLNIVELQSMVLSDPNTVELRSVILSDLNIVELQSVALSDLNIVELQSVVLSNLNIVELRSVVLSDQNIVVELLSVVLSDLNIVELRSVVIYDLNVVERLSVVLSDLNIVELRSTTLYNLNVVGYRLVVLSNRNIVELRSVVYYKANILELRSEVLSDLNIVELRSMVLFDLNIVELRSVVLTDPNIVELRSVVLSYPNILELRTVVLSDPNIVELRSATLSNLNGIGLRSMVLSNQNIVELQSVVLSDSNIVELRLEVFSDLNIVELRSMVLFDLNIVELRSVVLTDMNIVELRSTVLCDVNIMELRSVVLSDLNIVELRSMVLSDPNTVELRSAVLTDLNIVELRSVALSDPNIVELRSVVLSDPNIVELRSATLSNLNGIGLRSMVLSNQNIVELQSVVLSDANIVELRLEVFSDLNIDELRSMVLFDLNIVELRSVVLSDTNIVELRSTKLGGNISRRSFLTED